MKLICLILFLGALPAVGADTVPLKTFWSKTYGFELDHPADFLVKESKGVKGKFLWRVSFYADPADTEPCFMVEARPLKALRIDVKSLGYYLYGPKKNEWRLEPGYNKESLSRLSLSYLTPARIPVYSSLHSMANAYRDDTILTDKGYALELHYSNATRRAGADKLNDSLAASFRLIGIKAREAKIIAPPPPKDE
ncbi:MAG: hypothetical protein Q7R35_12005 [Elusimicrobiota bacterium]|nr:hypothetical protein [Elusimicrobiota bacterium]